MRIIILCVATLILIATQAISSREAPGLTVTPLCYDQSMMITVAVLALASFTLGVFALATVMWSE